MATDAGPVSGSGKAARALGRRALLALALAALLPAAALAQSAGADGMIVIPGRGESAETALANANAHGVNTSAPRGSTSLNSYSAAELRGAYGGGSAVANGATSANDIVLAGSAPGAAPRPAMAAGANPNPGGMAGTRAVEVLSGGEAAMRAAASADPDANRPEPPLYPSRRANPGAQPANSPARPGAAQPSQDAATYAADYAAGYAAGIAAARRAAQAAPAGPAAVATLRQPVAGILRVSTRAALPPAGDTAAAATGAATAQAQAAPPVPEGQQDPEAIRQAALAFLRQQTAGLPGKAIVTVAPAFPRGLAACTGLEPFLPTGARLWGRTTVGVRCAGAKPWTLYLQSKISVQGTYYVAARALSPGEVLTAADLVAHDGDLTQLPLAIITDPGQAVGGTSLVRVAAGLPLRQDMLRSAASVTIGQTVRVVAAGKGFTISSEGSVMNNAGPGQQVRVRLAAGQIVTAVVKDSGTVEIPL
ncbi:flagellar basal body P-ring formation chaperone FlgA [Burkholderia gladioli]|uniref:flagellar basal body P-ring formation chaperone FlgA n=2 Tax=Burkholderia gladioli TaxID=28095 RepID=UPI001FC8A95E|nr:flagellar basal body P-ring formation chaperone FlgA [Burkholderia gladioli]